MLNQESSERRLKLGNKPIKWRIPNGEDEWKRVPISQVPTYHIICLLMKFEKKGYSKINGLVNNEDEWQLNYITELENEFDRRTDVDEFL